MNDDPLADWLGVALVGVAAALVGGIQFGAALVIGIAPLPPRFLFRRLALSPSAIPRLGKLGAIQQQQGDHGQRSRDWLPETAEE